MPSAPLHTAMPACQWLSLSVGINNMWTCVCLGGTIGKTNHLFISEASFEFLLLVLIAVKPLVFSWVLNESSSGSHGSCLTVVGRSDCTPLIRPLIWILPCPSTVHLLLTLRIIKVWLRFNSSVSLLTYFVEMENIRNYQDEESFSGHFSNDYRKLLSKSSDNCIQERSSKCLWTRTERRSLAPKLAGILWINILKFLWLNLVVGVAELNAHTNMTEESHLEIAR